MIGRLKLLSQISDCFVALGKFIQGILGYTLLSSWKELWKNFGMRLRDSEQIYRKNPGTKDFGDIYVKEITWRISRKISRQKARSIPEWNSCFVFVKESLEESQEVLRRAWKVISVEDFWKKSLGKILGRILEKNHRINSGQSSGKKL